MSLSPEEIQEFFGGIDVYLFDQLQKGRIKTHMRILDAGCGAGRNIRYLMRSGLEVYAVDQSPAAINDIRQLAKECTQLPADKNFVVAPIEEIPFENEMFDFIISNAVLHFAKNQTHFQAMLNEMWRVLKPAGIFFCRLASDIGIEEKVELIEDGIYLLPDGSKRFLVNEQFLLNKTKQLGANFLEPIKTVNVQGMRCMTTWCLSK